MALVLVLLIIGHSFGHVKKQPVKGLSEYSTTIQTAFLFLAISFVLTLFQIAMGTQVRQFVDDANARLQLSRNASAWLNNPTHLSYFMFHRSFSTACAFSSRLLGVFTFSKENTSQCIYCDFISACC